MRVCIEPRLLPGVRCSVLKTVKSWPSCWITMPGRSCVALTLLIFFCGPERVGADCSLERLRISEIQAGQEHGLIRNDSRHAGAKSIKPARVASIRCLIDDGQSGCSVGSEPPKNRRSLSSITLT